MVFCSSLPLGFASGLKDKAPADFSTGALRIRSLAVTYSCMPKGHTTIGAERFHFRVRKGIGWFPLAMAARQTGLDEAANEHLLIRPHLQFGVVSTLKSKLATHRLISNDSRSRDRMSHS